MDSCPLLATGKIDASESSDCSVIGIGCEVSVVVVTLAENLIVRGENADAS